MSPVMDTTVNDDLHLSTECTGCNEARNICYMKCWGESLDIS